MNPIQETIFDFIEGPGAFYGYFLQRINIGVDNKQPTIYISGDSNGQIRMNYNEEWFNNLPAKERMAVIEHEILHIANKHGKRFDEERNLPGNHDKATAYLIGADCAINQLVDNMPKDSVTYEKVKQLLEQEGIAHGLEQNREAEYYVNYLKMVKASKPMGGKGDKGGQGCNHFDKSSQEKGMDDVSNNEVEEIVKESAKQAGSVPAGIEKILEELTRITKLNWKQLLRLNCAKSIKAESRPSWKRLRRRSEVEVKGHVNNYKPRIVVAIDTSGSIYGSPGTLEEFTGQLSNIQSCFGGEFTVVECDAQIQKVYKLRRSIKPDRKFKGGGGTDFRPVFDLCEKELKPGLLIFFTDGEGAFPSQAPHFKTLWASIYDNKSQYPFGDYIKIDINEK